MKLNKEICKKCISKKDKNRQYCNCKPQPKFDQKGRIYHILLRNDKIKITVESGSDLNDEDNIRFEELEEFYHIPENCPYRLEHIISGEVAEMDKASV